MRMLLNEEQFETELFTIIDIIIGSPIKTGEGLHTIYGKIYVNKNGEKIGIYRREYPRTFYFRKDLIQKFITYSGISNDEEVRTMFAKWLMSRKNLKVLDVDSIIPVLLNIIPIK